MNMTLNLDHPKLRAVLKSTKRDEPDPQWEVVVLSTNGTRQIFDSEDHGDLVVFLDQLIDDPLTAAVELTLWAPRP